MSDRHPTDPILLTKRPFDPNRPFRRSAAFANGITRKHLDGPRFKRVARGVYVASGTPLTYAVRIEAVAQAALYGVFSHLTAAHLLGAPTPRHTEVHLMIHQGKRRVIEGAHVHRRVRPPNWVAAKGFAVTDPIDTIRDLAAVPALDFVDLVAVGDGLVRAGHLTADELRERLRHPEHPWDCVIERAVAVAGFVRDKVDSAMETRTRLLLIMSGLPEPEVNYPIKDRKGRVLRWIDMAYPELKIAIEYDGRYHMERQEQWHADILRREGLEGKEWRFVVITASDFANPQDIVARVASARQQRGAK